MSRIKRINPYKSLIIILILTFIIFMTSGVTLGYINGKGDSRQVSAIVFNEGELAINYLDGNEIKIEYPYNKSYEYNFSVTNTGTSKIYYSMYLKNVEVINKNIKIKLLDDNKKVLNQMKLVNGENLLQSVKIIEPGVTDRYKIVVNNKNNKTDLSGLIKIQNESNEDKTLQDLILSDNVINISSKTKVGELSTTNEGLVKTVDDYGNSYYFRGNVNNNYILINNIMFRIIRINGDGTIRIILDDKDDSLYMFNSNNIDDKEKMVIFENSSIKEELNNWFDKNLKEYESFFIASNFCSDSNFNNIVKNTKYTDTYNRISSDSPTLRCFTTSYLNKIGLISPDEIIFAGGSSKLENTSYYLYNKNIDYSTWTMGSYSLKNKDINMYILNSNGSLGYSKINSELHIRPVLNVKINANANGEGTIDNPYILVK